KALAQGLGSEAELAAMNEAQLHRFIFRAGFSTAAALTTVSGRGVGMDVVRTNIERIGGTVELRSTAGVGTTFAIRIPLTLAIVSVLLVEAGGERLAIPQLSVRELVCVARAGTDGGPVTERIGNTQVLRLRDRLLPLVSLQEMLGLPSPAQGDTSPVIIILQHGNGMLGLIVDRVFDTEEIVVKPVAPILRHITLFGGTTILGDGSVIMILDPNGVARACGVDAGDSAKIQTGGVPEAMRSGERTAMLLFRAGGPQLTAVPLGLVSRIEEIPREAIEITAGPPVTQYRGRLMPLIALSENLNHDSPRQLVLVFAEPVRSLGLMLDEIVDVVEDRLDVELTAARPGLLGTAVVGGRATDVLDTGYWLTRARTDWFGSHEATNRMQRILAVEDSDFFRRLLVPSLSAAGYHVTAAAGAAEALQLRDAGQTFDAIISDIEMPGMDGLTFARTIRAGSAWSALPMLALSARARPADVSAALGAGFTAHVTKFDREALIAVLQRCFADAAAA
ncbi:MAG TPA: chemotaxis protein CheW, partial [Acetobacteraceae bacterium]|nr:chemotaxis protein CheW [Acetobacteraceae bacterium]